MGFHYTRLCSLQIEYNKISHFYFKENSTNKCAKLSFMIKYT